MHTPPLSTDRLLPHAATSCVEGVFSRVFPLLRLRGRRVILLACAIALMSAVDLYLTLLYVTNMGMNEMNPLARAMMAYQSPKVLALWKFLTVALSMGILILIRNKRSAEWGAWVGFLVLGWLMSHWVLFVHEMRDVNLEVVQEIASMDPTWVMIDAAPREFRSGRIVID